jgi:tetratricopeptide (TPR) repeat protein
LIGDPSTAAKAGHQIHNLAFHMRLRGHAVTSPDVAGSAIQGGDRIGEARHLNNLAVDLYFDGNWEKAASLYREVAALCVASGDVVYEATALNNIAEILSDQGRLSDAESMLRTASRTWQSVGFATGVALAEANLGRLATRRRDYDRAGQLLDSALSRFEHLGAQAFVDEVRLRIFENRLQAEAHLDDAQLAELVLLSATPDWDTNLTAYADRLVAQAYALSGDGDRALSVVTHSIDTARSADLPFELAQSLVLRSELLGGTPQAHNDAGEAGEIFERLGCLHGARVD